MQYKVWIEVEEFDYEENDHYETMDLPFSSEATFDTLKEAIAYAKRMHDSCEDHEGLTEEEFEKTEIESKKKRGG